MPAAEITLPIVASGQAQDRSSTCPRQSLHVRRRPEAYDSDREDLRRTASAPRRRRGCRRARLRQPADANTDSSCRPSASSADNLTAAAAPPPRSTRSPRWLQANRPCPDPAQSRCRKQTEALLSAATARLCTAHDGRGDRIRTCDPLVPNQMRYQAAPLPDMSPAATATNTQAHSRAGVIRNADLRPIFGG